MGEKSYPFLNLTDSNSQYIDQMIEAATRVLKSGRYIGGEEVESFEKMLAAQTGTKYAVGVSNGLDALRLILRAYIELGRLNPGDEVIVPANTYIASVLAISDSGLKPVLADVNITTMNLDVDNLRKAISSKTRALMTVHLYGRIAWDESIKQTAMENDLIVIEDCAQAIGARAYEPGIDGGIRTGALGHAGAFSFYPTKNIGAAGDAGAVTTNDPELAYAVKALANYGSDRRYHNIYLGLNCRLDPIQAAILKVKLPHADEENSDRFAKALAYNRTLNCRHIIKPLISDTVTDNVWHQYVIRVKDGKRQRLANLLTNAGVTTDIHYATPPHLQPCYASLSHGPLVVTELLADQVLSLPIGPSTTVKNAAEIAEIINGLDLQ